jgi:hypothetical protein
MPEIADMVPVRVSNTAIDSNRLLFGAVLAAFKPRSWQTALLSTSNHLHLHSLLVFISYHHRASVPTTVELVQLV